MVQASDSLEILLPAADETLLRRARPVVQFMRLLADDARSTRAGAVAVGLEQARCELEKQDRLRVEEALTDLLRHHVAALATSDTFLGWGEPGLDHATAWRVLDEFRDDLPWLAGVPEPAEPAEAVAWRVLDCRERLAACEAEALAWKARITRFTEGPRAAEMLLRAHMQPMASKSSLERAAYRACVAVLAECLLDRGAVREARAWLQENMVLFDGDPRLRQLLCWTLVCLGDYPGAKSAVVGMPPWSGPLSSSLVELRAHRPEWLPCLSGRAAPAVPTVQGRSRFLVAPRIHGLLRERSEIGAAVLGVFVFHSDGGVHPLLLDAAPALRRGIAAWIRQRDGACAVAGQREHELVVSARAVVIHRDGDRPIEGALGREGTRALVLAPVLDDEGEVAGWLHVECEHHRLPSPFVLSGHAANWREEVLAHRDGDAGRSRSARVAPSPALRNVAPEPHRAACAEVFEGLVAELGIKTAQRRWWGFGLEGPDPRLLAMGGEGGGLSSESNGRGRALTRAVATAGRVSFDDPDPHLSIDPRSGSGVVLPLTAGGVLCGLLAIESSRRRDFRDADLERFTQAVQRGGLALRLAQFVEWHRERFGCEIWFDALRPEFRGFARDFLAAARSRSPVVLYGPPGAGKTILARWLHFESRTGDGPIRVVDCGSPAHEDSVKEWIDSTRGGTLILEDVERLTPGEQEELLRVLEREEGVAEGEPPPARVLATTRVGLKPATQDGRLRDDLAQRLDRLQFRLPGLRDRREDILPLVTCLARRFAREENIPVPGFSDEALALLWRQSWDGNVRELENLVYKLVLLARSDRERATDLVGPPQILEIAARFSLQTVRRLPSRHPVRSDLLAALRVTRKPGGRVNKTRAALYLGWDPDTLVARMQDAGIGEEIRDEDAWTIPTPAAEDDPE